MHSFLLYIFTKHVWMKYKLLSSLFQHTMAFFSSCFLQILFDASEECTVPPFSLTETKPHMHACFSVVFVILHSPFLPRSSPDSRTATGMIDRKKQQKNIFVGVQVLQVTFGVYVCFPLCICVHVFAYWLYAGCWPFADKAWSYGGPVVVDWYCLSVMPGSLGSCVDP